MRMGWLVLAVALATALPQSLQAFSQHAIVLSIGDGDSLRVRHGGRTLTVRLACIDAPEISQSPWGQQARQHLRQTLPIGREVLLDIKAKDRYGRAVAEVIDDSNIGLQMVEEGQAFAYRRYLNNCDARAYLDAEARASRRRQGVWQPEGGITRPWLYRRR